MPISFKPKPVSKQDIEQVLPARIQAWVDEFDRAGLQYGLNDRDEQEIKFEHRARQRPDTLQVHVGKIVRLKDPSTGDEFMYYTCQKSVLDKNDNPVKYDNVYGIHPIPVTEKRRDENDMKVPANLSHYGISYDIPWSEAEFDRLVKAANNRVSNLIITQTSQVWNQRYSGISYHILNRDDFRNLSWEELVKQSEEGETNTVNPKKKRTRADKGVRKLNRQVANRQISPNVNAKRNRPVETKPGQT